MADLSPIQQILRLSFESDVSGLGPVTAGLTALADQATALQQPLTTVAGLLSALNQAGSGATGLAATDDTLSSLSTAITAADQAGAPLAATLQSVATAGSTVTTESQAAAGSISAIGTNLALVDSQGRPAAVSLENVATAEQQAAAAGAPLVAQLADATAQTQQLGGALDETTPKHQAHGAAASEAGKSLGELSTATREVANEALPGLSTSLSAATNLFGAARDGMKAVSDEESSFTQTTALMGAGLATVGVTAAAGFFGVFDSGLTTLHNLSTVTGMTIPAVAGLGAAMQSVGLPADAVDRGLYQLTGQLQAMQDQVTKGKEPTGRLASGLDSIGVSAVGANGQIQPLNALLPTIMDRFKATADAAQASGEPFNAAGVAAQIFGQRLGPQLVPLLLQGSGALDEFTQKAQQLGIGSEEQVAHLEALHQATATASLEFRGMAMEIGSDVAPAVTAGIKLAGDLADAYGKLPAPLRDAVVTFPLAAGGALLLSSGLSAVGGVIGTVTSSFGALSTALGITAAAEEAETVAAEGAEIATASVVPAIGLVVAATAAIAIGLHAWLGSSDEAAAGQKQLSQAAQDAAKSIDQETQAALRSGQSLPSVYDQLRTKQQQAIADNDAASAALEAYTQKLAAMNGGQIKSTADLEKHDATFKALSDDVAKTSAQVTGYDTELGKLSAQATSAGQSLTALAGSGAAWGPQDSLLRVFTSDVRDAATTVTGLSGVLDSSAVRLANQAAATKTLDDAVKAASGSQRQQAVFQQQLSDALAHYNDTAPQAAAWQQKLKDLADSGDATLKTYADDQQKLDSVVQVLGPDVAALTSRHQELADALGVTTQNTITANDRFTDTIQLLKDTATGAQEAGDALLGMESKPSQAELDAKARLADLKASLTDLNATLANSSPAEQHIAALEAVYQNDIRTGASTDTVSKAKAELDNALANSSSAAAAGVALQDHIDALKRDETGQQANYDKLVSGREAMAATVTAQTALASNSAATTQQQADAYQAYEQKVTGTVNTVHDTVVTTGAKTGADGTAAVASSLSAGSPAIAEAGSANVVAYAQALQAGYDATKTGATNAAAQLAGALTQPGEFTTAGQTDGQAFGGAVLAAVQDAMRKAAAAVQAGGATIAGIASAAGTPGAYQTSLGTGPGGFTYPAQGPITQGFGVSGEKGIDIGVPTGTSLTAGIAGKVVNVQAPTPAQAAEGLGYWVTIDAGNGLQEVIGHMDSIAVQLGDVVKQGQQIGLSGGEYQAGSFNPSISSGPHTEVQVLMNGQNVDPQSVLGKVLGSTPGSTTDAGTATLNFAGSAGGILPPSWYAAIQANESTLPLPSAGAPEPMFGFVPGAPGNVGTGYYSSGGSAAASASLGVPAGSTAQSLFPSVQAGIAAFDALIQSIPGAVAAAQSGDFAHFLQTIAPTYAGPGEAAGWPGQVLSHYQAGAALPGTATTPGGPEELPPPALASTAATPAAALQDQTQAQNDLNAAQRAGNDLVQQGNDLQKQRTDAAPVMTATELDGLHATTEAARAKAGADLAATETAQQAWQAAVGGYDATTKASKTYSQAEINDAKSAYDARKQTSDQSVKDFNTALSAEQKGYQASDQQQAAAAQAQQAYAAAKRSDLQAETQLTDALGKTWQQVITTYTTAGASLGADFDQQSTLRVSAAHDAATSAASAWVTATGTVLGDQQALTGVMSDEDRKQLEDKLKTDEGIQSDAKATSDAAKANFDAEAQAFDQYQQHMVQAHQQAQATLLADTKTFTTMDAQAFDDWTNHQLAGVGLTVSAQTQGSENQLATARATYLALMLDSSQASEQLQQDLTAEYETADASQKAILAGKIQADQARIASDNTAASAVAADYQTIQTSVTDAEKTEIDAAKAVAQARVTSDQAALKSAIDTITTEKQAVTDATNQAVQQYQDQNTAANAAIDAGSKQQIDAIQAQLDAEAAAAETKKRQDAQAAVAAATTPQARAQAEQALTQLLQQEHDKQLQDQIHQIQAAAAAQKQANDAAAKAKEDAAKASGKAQTEELDKEAKATTEHYNGLIADQNRYIKQLDAAAAAHYTHSTQDAVQAAITLLGQIGVVVAGVGGVSPVTGAGTVTLPPAPAGGATPLPAPAPPSPPLQTGHWQGNQWVTAASAADVAAPVIAQATQQAAASAATTATATTQTASTAGQTLPQLATHAASTAGTVAAALPQLLASSSDTAANTTQLLAAINRTLPADIADDLKSVIGALPMTTADQVIARANASGALAAANPNNPQMQELAAADRAAAASLTTDTATTAANTTAVASNTAAAGANTTALQAAINRPLPADIAGDLKSVVGTIATTTADQVMARARASGALAWSNPTNPQAQELAAADASAAGLPGNWWIHGVPGGFGPGFGGATATQAAGELAGKSFAQAVADLLAHPDQWEAPLSAELERQIAAFRNVNQTGPLPADLAAQVVAAEGANSAMTRNALAGQQAATSAITTAATTTQASLTGEAAATVANTAATVANTAALLGTAAPTANSPAAATGGAPAAATPPPLATGHWQGNAWVTGSGQTSPADVAAPTIATATQATAASTATTATAAAQTLPQIVAHTADVHTDLTGGIVPALALADTWLGTQATLLTSIWGALTIGPDAGHNAVDHLTNVEHALQQQAQGELPLLTGLLNHATSIDGTLDEVLAAVAAAPDTSSKPAAAVKRFALGGPLTEPVFGLGLSSGQQYLLAESGPEYVVPAGRGGGGGTTFTGNISVTIPVRDLAELQQVNQFFDRIGQAARAAGAH